MLEMNFVLPNKGFKKELQGFFFGRTCIFQFPSFSLACSSSHLPVPGEILLIIKIQCLDTAQTAAPGPIHTGAKK